MGFMNGIDMKLLLPNYGTIQLKYKYLITAWVFINDSQALASSFIKLDQFTLTICNSK